MRKHSNALAQEAPEYSQKEVDRQRSILEKEKAKLEKEIDRYSQPAGLALLQKRKDDKREALTAAYNEVCEKLSALNEREDEWKQAEKEKAKKAYLVLAIALAVCLAFLGIASLLKKWNPKPAEQTDAPTSATTATEPEAIHLTPPIDSVSLAVGETDTVVEYRVDPLLFEWEMDSYGFTVVVDDPEVARAELSYTDGSDFHLILTAVNPGQTSVQIVDQQNKVTCQPLAVTVTQPETSSEPDATVTEPEAAAESVTAAVTESEKQELVLNTNTMRIHYPYCDSVGRISKKNKKEVIGTIEEFKAQGYKPCGRCNPH